MTVDLYFRINTLADFMDDLDAFTGDHGYPSLTPVDEDGVRFLPTVRTFTDTRYDFDVINNLEAIRPDPANNKDAILRGPHVNVRVSLMPGGNSAVMDQVVGNLRAFFDPLADVDYSPPQEMLDRLGIGTGDIKGKMKRTPRATGLIRRMDDEGNEVNVPEFPKRVWA